MNCTVGSGQNFDSREIVYRRLILVLVALRVADRQKAEDAKWAWWKTAWKYPQHVEMIKALPGYVVYCEVFGQVQDLKYGRSGVDFVAFDIMSPSARFLDYRESCSLFDRFGVPKVPELYVGPYDRDNAVSLAEGPSMVPGANHVGEGCVIRPIRERVDVRLGRKVLKIVGNGYLERADKATAKAAA